MRRDHRTEDRRERERQTRDLRAPANAAFGHIVIGDGEGEAVAAHRVVGRRRRDGGAAHRRGVEENGRTAHDDRLAEPGCGPRTINPRHQAQRVVACRNRVHVADGDGDCARSAGVVLTGVEVAGEDLILTRAETAEGRARLPLSAAGGPGDGNGSATGRADDGGTARAGEVVPIGQRHSERATGIRDGRARADKVDTETGGARRRDGTEAGQRDTQPANQPGVKEVSHTFSIVVESR